MLMGSIAEADRPWAFDGNGEAFRSVAEASHCARPQH